MYESFFGFTERPFSLLPDPAFLYLGKSHGSALDMLEYGLLSQAGFTVITGEVGCGKTTLVRHLLDHLDAQITVGLITNTHSGFGSLLRWVLHAYDLEPRATGKVGRYRALQEFVIAQYAAGKRTVLMIDEAQNLEVASLEELRLLSNLNVDKHQVLQIVLVGQPELRGTLSVPGLRQFRQRIAVDHHLGPLSLGETVGYVRHRLTVAAGDPALFSPAALNAVHRHAHGVPRMVNLICDTALTYAYGARVQRVGTAVVAEVVRDKARGGLFGLDLASAPVPSLESVPAGRASGPRAPEAVPGEVMSLTGDHKG